jgi:hypothetical protein
MASRRLPVERSGRAGGDRPSLVDRVHADMIVFDNIESVRALLVGAMSIDSNQHVRVIC